METRRTRRIFLCLLSDLCVSVVKTPWSVAVYHRIGGFPSGRGRAGAGIRLILHSVSCSPGRDTTPNGESNESGKRCVVALPPSGSRSSRRSDLLSDPRNIPGPFLVSSLRFQVPGFRFTPHETRNTQHASRSTSSPALAPDLRGLCPAWPPAAWRRTVRVPRGSPSGPAPHRFAGSSGRSGRAASRRD